MTRLIAAHARARNFYHLTSVSSFIRALSIICCSDYYNRKQIHFLKSLARTLNAFSHPSKKRKEKLSTARVETSKIPNTQNFSEHVHSKNVRMEFSLSLILYANRSHTKRKEREAEKKREKKRRVKKKKGTRRELRGIGGFDFASGSRRRRVCIDFEVMRLCTPCVSSTMNKRDRLHAAVEMNGRRRTKKKKKK